MTVIYYVALFLFVILCALLCLVILIQESKSMGLGSSFGEDPSDSIFGTATADVLKKITSGLAIAFMASCVLLSLWTTNLGRTDAMKSPVEIEDISE